MDTQELYRMAKWVLYKGRQTATPDLVQELVLVGWKAQAKWEEEKGRTLGNWIIKAMRWRLDSLSEKGKQKQFESNVLLVPNLTLAIDAPPSQRIEDADVAPLLLKAIASLSQREKEVIEARYGLTSDYNMSLKEIAEIVEKTEGHRVTQERVRQIEAKALRKLYSLLKEVCMLEAERE